MRLIRPQRGNILFLLLLAVVLFAALSYAVTSSTRGGGKDASTEKINTMAAQIVQTGTLMENTVTRMRLSGECKETELRFDNTLVTGYDNLSGTPADKHCYVFEPAGGGTSIPMPPKEALDTAWEANINYGNPWFTGSKIINGNNTSTSELSYFVPFLKEAVCRQINASLYAVPSNVTIAEDNTSIAALMDSKFRGTYGQTIGDIDGYGTSPVVVPWYGFWRAKISGCTRTTDGMFFYFHVLIPR